MDQHNAPSAPAGKLPAGGGVTFHWVHTSYTSPLPACSSACQSDSSTTSSPSDQASSQEVKAATFLCTSRLRCKNLLRLKLYELWGQQPELSPSSCTDRCSSSLTSTCIPLLHPSYHQCLSIHHDPLTADGPQSWPTRRHEGTTFCLYHCAGGDAQLLMHFL